MIKARTDLTKFHTREDSRIDWTCTRTLYIDYIIVTAVVMFIVMLSLDLEKSVALLKYIDDDDI